MRRFLAIGGLSLLLALPVCAQQQSDSQSANTDRQKADQPKKDQAKKPPAGDNPFPQEQSEKAAHPDSSAPNPAPQDSAPPDASHRDSEPPAPQPHAGASTADQNPFPEAQSEKAAQQAQQPEAPAPAPQGQSGANGQDSSSSAIKGLNLQNLSPRGSDGGGGTVLSPELGRKDIKVGNFYLQTGEFKGAYDRFVEAIKVDPTSAEAVYGLADAARHLNQRDEAIRNYQLYLTAVPDGPHSKDARKALKEMGAKH